MDAASDLAPDYGRWTYGDAGDRWPVRPGEVWAVGPHLIACGDLQPISRSDPSAPRLMRRMLGGREPALCWTDPPWDRGNAASFRTKARVARGSLAPETFRALLSAIARVAALAPEAYVEFGRAEAGSMIACLMGEGMTLRQRWSATYYRRHPCVHMRFVRDGADAAPLDIPDGLDDVHLPGLVMDGLGLAPGAVVIDPCTGRGLVAEEAHRRGLTFVGTELHPRRMAVTLDKLHNLGAGEPRRVPELEG